jgi:hypothetical protein
VRTPGERCATPLAPSLVGHRPGAPAPTYHARHHCCDRPETSHARLALQNPTGVDALTWTELPTPTPKAGEVLIEIKAASLNFPDLLIVQNKYQMKPPLPFVPGSEYAGVVAAVGEGVTTSRSARTSPACRAPAALAPTPSPRQPCACRLPPAFRTWMRPHSS